MKNRNAGQSMIEVVFSIGIIMLVVSGVVFLVLASVRSKTKSYDRKKAVEISQSVIEDMIQIKNTDSVSFWDLGSAYWTALSLDHTVGEYTYSVEPAVVSGNGCSAIVTECLDVKVNIGWKDTQSMDSFNRFFSKR